MSAFQLIRDVTLEECHWLNRTFLKDEIVYKYNGHTYGCISWKGLPFTLVDNTLPFFELPYDAVEPL